LRIVSLDPTGAGPGTARFRSWKAYSLKIITSGAGVTLPVGVAINDYFEIDTSDFTLKLHGGQFSLKVVGNDIFLNFTPKAPSSLVLSIE